MVPPSAAVRTSKIYLLAAQMAGFPVEDDSYLVLAIEGDEDRHGERSKAAIAERRKFSALLKMLRDGLT